MGREASNSARSALPSNELSWHLEKKSSAAAEVMPLSRTSSWKEASCPTPVPARSRTVENLHSPQHDDDGRYQRGRRQYFQGSDSHTPTPLPSPAIGLFDSFGPPQLRDQLPRTIAARLCFARHIGHVEFRIGARGSQDRLSESLTPPLPPVHSAPSSRAARMPSANRRRDRSGHAA